MNILTRIDAACESVVKGNPVIGFLGIIATLLVFAGMGAFIAIKAPLLFFTILGVGFTWVLVLFLNKFIEAFKRK